MDGEGFLPNFASIHHEPNSSDPVPTESEISLMSDEVRPTSTDELKSMLETAGTELTVKYITGEINFQDFYAELERRKCLSKPAKQQESQSSSSSSSSFPDFLKHANLLHFDQLMEDVGEDDVSNDEDEERMDVEKEDDDIETDGILDKDDGEWSPDEQEKKELKSSKRGPKRPSNKEKTGILTRKRKKRGRRCLYELPKELAGMNGQAMLLRAQGRIEESMKILFEIIEKAPNSAAPFKTLGSIHEEKGDIEQALKFYMVSANLRKSDIGEWFDLIDMWIRLKNEKMVLMCFSKAFKYARTREDKLDVLGRRCMYFEEFGHPQKTILQCKGQILNYMDRSKPAEMLEFGRSLTKDFLDTNDVNEAVSTMLLYFQHLPEHIDAEDVHSLVELLMSQHNYIKSLEMIFKHCGVEVEMNGAPVNQVELNQIFQSNPNTKDDIPSITKISVPSLMPIDLRCKAMQCLMLAKVVESTSAFQELLTDLQESDVEEYGDVYYDVADTMVENGYLEDAKILLRKLTNSQNYSKAAVWLTYGICLNSLGNIEEAARAYSKVVEFVPGHLEARVTLSSLEQQLGHHEKALAILSKDTSKEGAATNDQLLLLHRSQLLYSQGKMEEFIDTACQLLSFNIRGQFTPEFMRVLMTRNTVRSRSTAFRLINQARDKDEESADNLLSDLQQSEKEKFSREIWDIYMKLSKEMYGRNRLDELVEISVLSVTCPTFCFNYNDSKILDAEFMCLKICVFSGRRNIVYNALRQCLAKEKHRNQAWNLYCYVVTIFKNLIDLRFALRALMMNPNNLALGMLNGSARLISGTYIQALGEFLSVYRQDPNNDLPLLCCALCLVHLSLMAYTGKRNSLVSQTMCLLNAYKDARGENQETYYNLGRVMQQLNMPFLSVHYYKKALTYPPIVEDEKGRFDLSHEIAFNLSLIYRKSGNKNMARYYLQKYCVI